MSETIAFPDVTTVLRSWLLDTLPEHGLTLPVYTRVPNPRPDRFVVLLRTGGPREGLVTDAAQVTIEVWDRTAATDGGLPPVAASSRIVRAVLGAARNVRTPSDDLIYRIDEAGGPAPLPDVSGHPRYSWTVQVYTRGVAL